MKTQCSSCKVDCLLGKPAKLSCYACTILRGMAHQTIQYALIARNEGWVEHAQFEPMMN
jgi:hypothetical protein